LDKLQIVTNDTLARYAEPHRHYHVFEHVERVWTHINELCGLITPRDHELLVLAAGWHDVIYDPREHHGRNELASAQYADDAAIYLGGQPRAELHRLICLTAMHTPDSEDVLGGILCDADLADLGSDRYTVNSAKIRLEYSYLDDAAWLAGRTTFLNGMLQRKYIFSTDRGREWYEKAARKNILDELERLAHCDTR
jgi:predicted metal-dependent HD superfamily phosphohydrolase